MPIITGCLKVTNSVLIYETASVSATVTSHISDFPLNQGTFHFPSDRARPHSSLQAKICAAFNAWQTMS